MTSFIITTGTPAGMGRTDLFRMIDPSTQAKQSGPDDHSHDVSSKGWDVHSELQYGTEFHYGDSNVEEPGRSQVAVTVIEFFRGWFADDVRAILMTGAITADEMEAAYIVVPRSIGLFPEIGEVLGKSARAQKIRPGEDKVFVFTPPHTNLIMALRGLESHELGEGKDPAVDRLDVVGGMGPSVPRCNQWVGHLLNLHATWEDLNDAVLESCMRESSVPMGVKTKLFVAMNTVHGKGLRSECLPRGLLEAAEDQHNMDIYLANVRFGYRGGVLQPSPHYVLACICNLLCDRVTGSQGNDCKSGAVDVGYIGKASLRSCGGT